jgi:hypothetical protein
MSADPLPHLPLSAAALARISHRHARYKAILEARVRALVTRCDAAESLPNWEVWLAELAEIGREASILVERSRRHQERAVRWLRRVPAEPKAPPLNKQH